MPAGSCGVELAVTHLQQSAEDATHARCATGAKVGAGGHDAVCAYVAGAHVFLSAPHAERSGGPRRRCHQGRPALWAASATCTLIMQQLGNQQVNT
jgi:hypothetical protein